MTKKITIAIDAMGGENSPKKNIEGLEGRRKFNAVWISVSDFLNKKYKIYPKEIVKYL